MRNLIGLLLFVFFSTYGMAQKNERLQLLEESMVELQKSPTDSVRQRNFFNAFPDNFPELLVCLGSTSFTNPLLDYEDYVAAFRKLNYISEREKMVRLSHLMIGGLWNADGINQTWAIMKELMRKDADRALEVVSALTECQQILFWQCFWQNPCNDPSLDRDFNLFNSISGYNRERTLMREAYKVFKGELPVVY